MNKFDIDIDSFYEGHSMDLVTFATRVCKVLGVETMIGMEHARRELESSANDGMQSQTQLVVSTRLTAWETLCV